MRFWDKRLTGRQLRIQNPINISPSNHFSYIKTPKIAAEVDLFGSLLTVISVNGVGN